MPTREHGPSRVASLTVGGLGSAICRSNGGARRVVCHAWFVEADGRAVYEDLVGRPWGSLSPRQRAIGGFGSLPIEVDNGGFDQYFYNSAGDFALEGLAAAEALNILRLADVLRRALEMLPGGYSAERTVRQAALRSTQRSRWTPLNKEFYALEREIDFEAALNTLAADI